MSMFKWAEDLFPVNRSLTGRGNVLTLEYMKGILPELQISSFKSGTNVFDWTIPDEWNVIDAYIENERGEKIVDFKKNNLHLVGYSDSFNGEVSLNILNEHLYSLPDQPDAIPYITSYYEKRWGFCIKHSQREELRDEKYTVMINSTHKKGLLHYGEVLIPATVKTKDEIFFSTYICHPSMANNELSGPVVSLPATAPSFEAQMPAPTYGEPKETVPTIGGTPRTSSIRRTSSPATSG